MKFPLLIVLALFTAVTAFAESDEPGEKTVTLEAFTEELRHLEGFLRLYVDDAKAKVYAELSGGSREAIYVTYLASGAGANALGMDRNQIGETRFVRFRRVGERVFLVQPNLRYRASSDNPAEIGAVVDAFATSILASFPIVAEDSDTVLFELTELITADVLSIVQRLEAAEQEGYTLDSDRSAVLPRRIKNFPRNSVLESWLTFASDKAADLVSKVTPTPTAMTLRVRHDFVQPPTGYEPRVFHPRSGYFQLRVDDLAAPLDEPITQRFIVRHRLAKKDSSASVSEPVEPIVYFVDSGAPEPIRSALIDGASWWNQAFEAAGLENAFRVEVLPAEADPLDIRFNVINWVHRAERGWSYGYGVVDPRTGEMIKGNVTLGSRRVRQDMRIFQALLNDGASPQAREAALARLRQLSAHEVGHTLGLAHNFAASMNRDASVMDYPHPFVRLDEGSEIDLSSAYGSGVGAWDKLAIRYGYGDEADMDRVVVEARQLGLDFLSDFNARTPQAAHAKAHLWDNGSDAIARLGELGQIRELALERLGIQALLPGADISDLERKMVPVYLLDRYQAEAVAKLVGGQDFSYETTADEPARLPAAVLAERQTRAMEMLVGMLDAQRLKLPDALLAVLMPPPNRSRTEEDFHHTTGSVFDSLAPARAAAQHIVSLLFEPHRLARLHTQQLNDADLPGLEELWQELEQYALHLNQPADSYMQSISQVVAWTAIHQIQRGLQSHSFPSSVSDFLVARLGGLLDRYEAKIEDGDFYFHAAHSIERFLRDPEGTTIPAPHPIPPGSPI